jgi:hypothetical protein
LQFATAQVIDELTISPTDYGDKVLTGAEVTSLHYSEKGVMAVLKDGRRFNGNWRLPPLPTTTHMLMELSTLSSQALLLS